MLICMKHKIEYTSECPECKKIREGISLRYTSTNPEHISDYMLNQVNKLNSFTAEIKKVSDKLQSLLKENKCKKD